MQPPGPQPPCAKPWRSHDTRRAPAGAHKRYGLRRAPRHVCLKRGAHLHAAADAARPAQVLVELHHGGRAAARALHEVANDPAAVLARDALLALESRLPTARQAGVSG